MLLNIHFQSSQNICVLVGISTKHKTSLVWQGVVKHHGLRPNVDQCALLLNPLKPFYVRDKISTVNHLHSLAQ